jgi:hypothetical protein
MLLRRLNELCAGLVGERVNGGGGGHGDEDGDGNAEL